MAHWRKGNKKATKKKGRKVVESPHTPSSSSRPSPNPHAFPLPCLPSFPAVSQLSTSPTHPCHPSSRSPEPSRPAPVCQPAIVVQLDRFANGRRRCHPWPPAGQLSIGSPHPLVARLQALGNRCVCSHLPLTAFSVFFLFAQLRLPTHPLLSTHLPCTRCRAPASGPAKAKNTIRRAPTAAKRIRLIHKRRRQHQSVRPRAPSQAQV